MLGLLLAYSLVTAPGILVAVVFYESLCYRDVLAGQIIRFAHRHTRHRLPLALAYGLALFVGIPVLGIWRTLWAGIRRPLRC
jgi:hypothetical protein